jgi:hypothetical protein
MLDPSTIKLKSRDKIVMGIIAAIFAAVVAIPVLTWTATIMGLLATVMENTVYFLALAGGTIFTLWTLWENRLNIIYKWKNISRNIGRSIARENPIGVMDTAIRRLENKLELISEKVAEADANRRQQEAAIKQFQTKATEYDSLADAAERGGKSERQIEVYAANAQRSRDSIAKVQPLATKFAEVVAKLSEARSLVISGLEDLKLQREGYKLEYDTLLAGSKAIKGFKSFFASNEDLDMLQLSIEEVDAQTAQYEAEIDQFIYDIQPKIEEQQLKQAATTQRAMDARQARKQVAASSTTGLPRLQLPVAKEGVVVR